MKMQTKKLDMQKLLAPAALVILYVVFSIFGKNFLTLDTVKNILESSYYIGFSSAFLFCLASIEYRHE